MIEGKKVVFKKEIIERMKQQKEYNRNAWFHITDGGGLSQSYTRDFAEADFLIVEDNTPRSYLIQYPSHLKGYCVIKDHVVPYCPIDITIDDKEWEW